MPPAAMVSVSPQADGVEPAVVSAVPVAAATARRRVRQSPRKARRGGDMHETTRLDGDFALAVSRQRAGQKRKKGPARLWGTGTARCLR